MTDGHVREQAHGQADRAREVGNDLDRDQDRRRDDGRAVREEQREELEAVLHEADQRDADKDEGCHREGHREVTGEGECARDQSQQVAEHDEHEQAEDEREVGPTLGADIVADHVRDDLVEILRRCLHAPGHERAALGADDHEDHEHGGGDRHPERRVGERDVELRDFELDDRNDRELFERTSHPDTLQSSSTF